MSLEKETPICLKCIHSRIPKNIMELTEAQRNQEFTNSRCAKTFNLPIMLVTGVEVFNFAYQNRLDEAQCGIEGKWYEESTIIQAESEKPYSIPLTLVSSTESP